MHVRTDEKSNKDNKRKIEQMTNDAKLQYFQQAAQEQVSNSRKSVYPPPGDHTLVLLSAGSKMRKQAFAPPVFYAKLLCIASSDPDCVGKVYDFVNSGNSDPKLQKIRAQDLKRFVMALPQATGEEPYYWTSEGACEYYREFGQFSADIFEENKLVGALVRCIATTKETKNGHTITVQDYSPVPDQNSPDQIAARVAQCAAQIAANPPEPEYVATAVTVPAVAVPPASAAVPPPGARPPVTVFAANPPPGARRPPPGR